MIIGALVVTHGSLGRVLVEETERLIGRQERFSALSTMGSSAMEITDRVYEIIQEDPWIVFTDTPGTSPTVRSVYAISSGQAVVTGVNLGMLLSFLVHRDKMPVEELAKKMVEDGRRTLEVLWPR